MCIASRLVVFAGLFAASAASAADLPLLVQPTAPPPPAAPDGSGFYAHIGAAGAFLDAGAAISSPLGRVPGASIKISPVASLAVEGGYRFTPTWGLSLSGGYPPTTEIDGGGTIRSLGRLGTNTAGPIALTAHYHFTSFGALQPYVGGGPAYLISFSDHDGVVRRFDVRSAPGAVVQVGADYRLTDHVGLFLDAKWAYLRTTSTGLVGSVPISAKVRLDPVIVTGGFSFHI